MGLALKRAGDFAAAEAAYESGLRAIAAGCPLEPSDDEWRESLRLSILHKMARARRRSLMCGWERSCGSLG